MRAKPVPQMPLIRPRVETVSTVPNPDTVYKQIAALAARIGMTAHLQPALNRPSDLDLAADRRLQLLSRFSHYGWKTGYPDAVWCGEDGRGLGMWFLGNDYRVKSTYYGGYPATYLHRIKALFPEKKRVLHLFSGMVDLTILPGDTVDISPHLGATYIDDAQTLKHVPLSEYDLILCDPPYSIEDAEHYKATMISRNKVFKQFDRLKRGTHVVWLDQVCPMWRKDKLDLEAVIGVIRSTNHRFRVVTIFRRL